MHVGVVVLHVVVQWVKRLQVVSTHLTRKEWFAIDVQFSVLLQGLFWHQRYFALGAGKISRVIMGLLVPFQFCWSQQSSATKFALKKTWKKDLLGLFAKMFFLINISWGLRALEDWGKKDPRAAWLFFFPTPDMSPFPPAAPPSRKTNVNASAITRHDQNTHKPPMLCVSRVCVLSCWKH